MRDIALRRTRNAVGNLSAIWETGDLSRLLPGRRLLVASVLSCAGLMALGVPVGPVAATVLALWGLSLLVRTLFAAEDRLVPGRIVMLTLAGHVAAVLALYTWSMLAGNDGFFFGDDYAYAYAARVAAGVFRGDLDISHGPPYWDGWAYLLSTFGYLEAVVFAVFGPSVLTMEIFNAGFITAAVLLSYDFARRIFGGQAALLSAIVIAGYPSLTIWTSINLKDALLIFLVTCQLTLLRAFQERPRVATVAAALLLLVPIYSMRLWIYYLAGMMIVAAVVVMPRVKFRPRMLWVAGTVLGVILIVQSQVSGGFIFLRSDFVFTMINIRHAMTVGARTAYAAPTAIPVRFDTGVALNVTTPPPVAGASSVALVTTPGAECAPTGVTVVVTPGTKLVLARTPTPGDTSPTATPEPRTVTVACGDQVVIADYPSDQLEEVLAQAPLGLMYALFAPFPWAVQTAADLAAALEMLLWDVILAAAAVSVWRNRLVWRAYAPMGLLIVGALAVFTLFEGNVGTLFRHRAMIIPFVIVLASPVLAQLIDRVMKGRAAFWHRGRVNRATQR